MIDEVRHERGESPIVAAVLLGREGRRGSAGNSPRTHFEEIEDRHGGVRESMNEDRLENTFGVVE